MNLIKTQWPERMVSRPVAAIGLILDVFFMYFALRQVCSEFSLITEKYILLS